MLSSVWAAQPVLVILLRTDDSKLEISQELWTSPASEIHNSSTCRRLTGIQRQEINISRSEWLGKQLSFMKGFHDAIDLSLSVYGIISLSAIRTNKCRDVLGLV